MILAEILLNEKKVLDQISVLWVFLTKFGLSLEK